MSKMAEQQEALRIHEDAQAPADPYAWWRRALAGGKIGSKELPVSDGAPQCGFYRMRKSTERRGMGEGVAPKIMVPVAIFEHEGEIVAMVDGKLSDVDRAWLYAAKHPVTEEAYRQAVETGQWPDVAEGAGIVAPPAPIGHNAPTDETEVFKDRIDTAKADLDKNYTEIKGDEHAARAQTLRATLLELHREADKKRAAEKEPHLEAGKAVDARWMPLVKEAKAAADQIAKALSAFLTKKAKAEAEIRRQEEAAQRAAEEAAAKEGKPAPEPAPEPRPSHVQTAIKGGHGRAATVKAVKVVTEITDQDALYGFLKTHPELRDFMFKLAQRAVNAGNEVPGVTIEEQRKVA